MAGEPRIQEKRTERAAKPDPLVGRELAGRYRVLRRIAKGGMGSVYEAEQVPLGRRVAIKILHEPPNSNDSASFERRFFLEASTLARLSHPHTVTLHDYGQTQDGTFYLVMEFVRGRTLSRLLQAEGPLSPERTISLMVQVARALKHAHRHGVVHRDLKPGNLLIAQEDGDDHVKVVDFGLVKLTEGDQSITVTGMILGSPHCMAPEQVQGDEIDERADIYALGVLLYRCMAGEYPFHGQTTTATMIAHVNEPIPQLTVRYPDLELPEGLEEIIERCLAKDPADRFPDMGAVIKALANCGELPPEEFTALSTIVEPAPSPRRPLIIGGALLLGALIVGGSFWLNQEPQVATAPSADGSAAARTVELSLRSTPSGAEVRSGERVLGHTPMNLTLESTASPDQRSFEFSLPGYVSARIERDLSAADQIEIATELERLDVPAVLELPPDPDLEELEIDRPRVAKPPRTTSKKTPTKTAEKTVEDTTTAEGTGEATTDGQDEKEAPAGYKANPFD